MNFDSSTFLLEILNFLVLVWLLGRFLYRPVSEAIERRRQSVARTLAEAESMRRDAEASQRDYRDRLAAWDVEKREAREQWVAELNAERQAQHEQLRQRLAAERDQFEAVETRRRQMRERELETEALALGGRFAARLLERMATPDLQARLLDLFIEELSSVPEDRWQAVATSFGEGPARAMLRSGLPLTEPQRIDLQQALSAQMGRPMECEFIADAALIAGIRAELGPLSLHANLGDELRFFTEVT